MISLRDWVGAVSYLIESRDVSGAFNLCCPRTPTNAEFTDALATALHRKAFLAVPAALMKFKSCRWRSDPEAGEYCTHRDVLPFAGSVASASTTDARVTRSSIMRMPRSAGVRSRSGERCTTSQPATTSIASDAAIAG